MRENLKQIFINSIFITCTSRPLSGSSLRLKKRSALSTSKPFSGSLKTLKMWSSPCLLSQRRALSYLLLLIYLRIETSSEVLQGPLIKAFKNGCKYWFKSIFLGLLQFAMRSKTSMNWGLVIKVSAVKQPSFSRSVASKNVFYRARLVNLRIYPGRFSFLSIMISQNTVAYKSGSLSLLAWYSMNRFFIIRKFQKIISLHFASSKGSSIKSRIIPD